MVHRSVQVCKTERNQRSRSRLPFLAPLCITPSDTVAAFALFKKISSLKSAVYRHIQTSKTDKGVRECKQPFSAKEDIPLLYPVCAVLSQELFASSEFFLHYYFQEERSVTCIIGHRIFWRASIFFQETQRTSLQILLLSLKNYL